MEVLYISCIYSASNKLSLHFARLDVSVSQKIDALGKAMLRINKVEDYFNLGSDYTHFFLPEGSLLFDNRESMEKDRPFTYICTDVARDDYVGNIIYNIFQE